MEPAALVLERSNQPVQLAPGRKSSQRARAAPASRRGDGLRVARVIHEDLQVVHLAEDTLNLLQLPEVGMIPQPLGFDGHLEAVAQLLEAKTHLVQPFSEVHGSGLFKRLLEGAGAVGHACLDRPPPFPFGGAARAILIGGELAANGLELPADSTKVIHNGLGDESGARLLAFGAQFRTEPALHLRCAGGEIGVEQRQEDVQLACWGEAARDLPEPFAQFLSEMPLELQERQDLAEPARRHAGAMYGSRVACGNAR
jgi:hypothetical protein